VNGITICCLRGESPIQLDGHDGFFYPAIGAAVTGLTFFCIAWLLSSFGASPVLSVCGGLITPLLVCSGISIIDWLYFDSILMQDSRKNGSSFFPWYCWICFVLDVVCFNVGSWYYLRRIEP
jgi:hypothetical protein